MKYLPILRKNIDLKYFGCVPPVSTSMGVTPDITVVQSFISQFNEWLIYPQIKTSEFDNFLGLNFITTCNALFRPLVCPISTSIDASDQSAENSFFRSQQKKSTFIGASMRKPDWNFLFMDSLVFMFHLDGSEHLSVLL